MESDFLKIRGVTNVESGYLGGDEKNPTYELVSSGGTGHAESIKVTFNPRQISYDNLLKVFWLSIDPTVIDRQFCDIGKQYRSAIFYVDDQQKKAAEDSLKWFKENFPNLVPVTEISSQKVFYPAEAYHQRYFQKNPIRYQFYRFSCGRDKRLKELYGEKRLEILRDKLVH